ncbi:hypothetical protein DYB32_008403 [Aphanomyces invadans]|uniref:RRM domain-containing protein n=1 Tax=Aphanomyces invadans TaxID=157072 RepID=A0A418AL46_9STRA|nr:hypothetical protein DYB32_008403 [Aphanomyces invadans]
MAEGSDNESSHREKDRKSSRKDRSDRDRSDRDRSEKKSSRRERKDDDKDRKSSRRRSRSYSPRYRSSRRSPSAEAAKPAAVVSAPATDDLNAIPPVDSAPPSNQPTITQMMLQYPSLSIQEIMAKMSQSQSTMSSVVSLKPMRELYVGNLPPNVTATQLQDFLGTIIQQVGLALQGQPGNPILSTWISTDGMYAFCEMRTVEECNLALMLNQLNLLGRQLKFGRPRSFVGPPQPMPVVSNRTQTALVNLGCIPNPMWFAGGSAACGLKDPNAIRDSHVYVDPAHIPPDNTSNRLLMVNIPTVLTEDQLDAFTLVKNAEGVSVGSALFEYEDNNVTEEAMNGLNGLDLGGHVLSVQRASKQGVLPKYKPKGEDSAKATVTPTQVIVLVWWSRQSMGNGWVWQGNMVQPAELEDDDEFADLKEDIEEECNKFGKVVALEVPRPKTGETILGVGKVFVRFESVEGAEKATKALTGRKFGGNIVQVEYMSLAKFETQDFA